MSENPKSEPAKGEPAKSETVKSEPAKSEPAKSETVTTEPVTTEPVKTEPAKTEPAKTETAKSETVKSEPGSFCWGTGRRKSAVARVRLFPGTGEITLNGREFKEFFPTVDMQNHVLGPLRATEGVNKYDVKANVNGGGPLGQSGAVRLGIARALLRMDAETEPTLREGGFLTRDARMKERKKYGQRGARRRFQFSKR